MGVYQLNGHRQLDYNQSKIGDLVQPFVERGPREKDISRKVRKRLSPTNSARLNRTLKELSPSAFKIHTLLWKWRGAPARGMLPYFTIHSLAKFCSLTRPTVRRGLTELRDKGWIRRMGYNWHEKSELYRLIPIRQVPVPDGSLEKAGTARPRREGVEDSGPR